MSDREPPVGLRPVQKRDIAIAVDARAVVNQRKEARVSVVQPPGDTFEIACDEGEYLGGDNTAPPPLAYFSSALAF